MNPAGQRSFKYFCVATFLVFLTWMILQLGVYSPLVKTSKIGFFNRSPQYRPFNVKRGSYKVENIWSEIKGVLVKWKNALLFWVEDSIGTWSKSEELIRIKRSSESSGGGDSITCVDNPCVHGSCVDNDIGYQCNCNPGWQGRNCDEEDFCSSQPCLHGGECLLQDGRQRCVCPEGFVGDVCQYNANECVSNPCNNNAICIDGVNRFHCDCPEGWTGDLCNIDINECESSPCIPGRGTCETPRIGMYLCRCTAGFFGLRCEKDVEECLSYPCLNGGNCIDLRSKYYCRCAIGFSGTNCEIETDECESQPCQNGALCRDEVNRYLCECTEGFRGILCEENVNECNGTNPCLNDGKCVDESPLFRCECSSGFSGKLCETDENECASAPCTNGGSCFQPNPGEYRCQCVKGYTGTNCETDINECARNPCKNQGTCSDEIGRATCLCLPGFGGEFCQTDIDECASNPCQNEGSCVDMEAEFTCFCENGFEGDFCQVDVNECSSYPCKNEGKCVDKVNGFECICNSGYIGENCEVNVDECTSQPCKNSGICTDGIASFSCACAAGYIGNTCELEVNECQSSPCLNGGTCTDQSQRYLCSCLPGYQGTRCEQNINECASIPCTNGGRCVDLINKYICECVAGFQATSTKLLRGISCETDMNECDSSPCLNGGTCENGMNSYRCHCPPLHNGDLCQNEIKLCTAETCKNGGKCNEDEGNIACECKPGYSGERCEANINECSISPCQNGGMCMDGIDTFTCICRQGYSGKTCNDSSEADASALKQMIFSIAPAGGILILCIIMIIIVVLCLRRSSAPVKVEDTNNLSMLPVIEPKETHENATETGNILNEKEGKKNKGKGKSKRTKLDETPGKTSRKSRSEKKDNGDGVAPLKKVKKKRTDKASECEKSKEPIEAEENGPDSEEDKNIVNNSDDIKKEKKSKGNKKKRRKRNSEINEAGETEPRRNEVSEREKKEDEEVKRTKKDGEVKEKRLKKRQKKEGESPKEGSKNKERKHRGDKKNRKHRENDENQENSSPRSKNGENALEDENNDGVAKEELHDTETNIKDIDSAEESNIKEETIEEKHDEPTAESIDTCDNDHQIVNEFGQRENEFSDRQKPMPTRKYNEQLFSDTVPQSNVSFPRDAPEHPHHLFKEQGKMAPDENRYHHQYPGRYFDPYGYANFYDPRYKNEALPVDNLPRQKIHNQHTVGNQSYPPFYPQYFAANPYTAGYEDHKYNSNLHHSIESSFVKINELPNNDNVNIKDSNQKTQQFTESNTSPKTKIRSPWELVRDTEQKIKPIDTKDTSPPSSSEKKTASNNNKDLKSPWQPVWKFNFPHLLMEDTQLDRIVELPTPKYGGKTFQITPRRASAKSQSPRQRANNKRIDTPIVDTRTSRIEPDENSSSRSEPNIMKQSPTRTFLKEANGKQSRRRENGHTFLQLDNNGSIKAPSPKVLSYSRHFTPSPTEQQLEENVKTKRDEVIGKFNTNSYRSYHERPISSASMESADQEEISERTIRPQHNLRSGASYRKSIKAVNFAPDSFPRVPPPPYRESEMTDRLVGYKDLVGNDERYGETGGSSFPNAFGIRNPMGMSRENAFVKRH